MKIITTDYNYNLYCYIQVKDIAYLTEIKKLIIFKPLLERTLKHNIIDSDFIRIKDPNMIGIILHCEEIIDFMEYQKQDMSYLTNYLVNSIYSNTEETKHKSDGIRDIIAFKKKELDYKIPIIPTREYMCLNTNLNISFQSSNIPNYYILKTEDNIPLQNKEYQMFLSKQILEIRNMNKIPKELLDIKISELGSYIIVRINKLQPKKESIFKRVLKKQSE